MLLGESARRMREPGEDVAQCADGKLDEDCLVTRVVVVRHDRTRLDWRTSSIDRPDLDPEAHVPSFGGVDEGALVFTFEKDIAGVEVAQADAPFAVDAGRQ